MATVTEVGVRELKRDLSGYLKRAAAGEEIRVTMRGEPMVRLISAVGAEEPAVDPVQAQWEALVAAGKVTLPTRPKPSYGRRTFRFNGSPTDEILADRAAEDA